MLVRQRSQRSVFLRTTRTSLPLGALGACRAGFSFAATSRVRQSIGCGIACARIASVWRRDVNELTSGRFSVSAGPDRASGLDRCFRRSALGEPDTPGGNGQRPMTYNMHGGIGFDQAEARRNGSPARWQ